jgi:hypothetical protein
LTDGGTDRMTLGLMGGWMDMEQTDRQTNRKTDRQTNKQTERQTNRQRDRWMDG